MRSARRTDEPHAGHAREAVRDNLRHLVRTQLLMRTCSAASIARLFSVHRRTLSRYLQTDGVAFRQVLDEIRFEIASELLAKTAMPIRDVAAVLKYSELSAFTRAFRRWSGQTPSAWRARHLGTPK